MIKSEAYKTKPYPHYEDNFDVQDISLVKDQREDNAV